MRGIVRDSMSYGCKKKQPPFGWLQKENSYMYVLKGGYSSSSGSSPRSCSSIKECM
jgi:hypothetical protein